MSQPADSDDTNTLSGLDDGCKSYIDCGTCALKRCRMFGGYAIGNFVCECFWPNEVICNGTFIYTLSVHDDSPQEPST